MRIEAERRIEIISEVFFVALPSIVLCAFWPEEGHKADTFLASPELATSGLVLVGLASSKVIRMVAFASSWTHAAKNAIYTIMVMAVILSVIFFSWLLDKILTSHDLTYRVIQTFSFVVPLLFYIASMRIHAKIEQLRRLHQDKG